MTVRGGADDTFTRHDLSARGFVGFTRFKNIDYRLIPERPGVYAVLREKSSRPVFLPTSPAGQFKGRDSTVPVADWRPPGRSALIPSTSAKRTSVPKATATFNSASRSSASTAMVARLATKAAGGYGSLPRPTSTSSRGW